MKSILTLLFLLTFCKHTNSQDLFFIDKIIATYETENFEKDGFPKVDYILNESVIDKTALSFIQNNRLSGLTSEELCHIRNQIKELGIKEVDSSMVKSKKIISSKKIYELYQDGYDGFWKNFEALYGKSGFYKISMPLFSKDRNKCVLILEVNYYKMKPTGFVYVCHKENDKWILKHAVLGW